MEENMFCRECNKETQVVFDHRQGDSICCDCGLVLEAWCIEETAEWRHFTTDQDSDQDPTRVGAPSNALLDEGVLTLTISYLDTKKRESNNDFNYRFNGRISNQDNNKALKLAYESIGWMAEKLGLVSTVGDDAKAIYKKAHDQNACRGRNCEAMAAACLYSVCKRDSSRTLREIAAVAGQKEVAMATGLRGPSEKEINKIMRRVLLEKKIVKDDSVINAGDLSRRCCFGLGMNHQDIKAVSETLNKLKENDHQIDIRRTPTSVLAGVVYMIVQLSNDNSTLKLTVQDVSKAAGVAAGTTRKAYKDLYPYASKIIPNSYAKLEDLKKLCIP